MVLWVGTALSFASVEVENGADCLTQEAVDLELRAMLDDGVVDRFVTHVVVRAEPDWIVALSVLDQQETLWTRELPFTAADCPYLPAVIARSVERGIATLPAWRLASPSNVPSEGGVLVSVLASGRGAVQGGFGPFLWLPVGRWAGAQLVLEGRAGATVPVSVGRLVFAGGSFSAGPAMRVPVGKHALRGSLRASVGPTWFRAEGFDRENYSDWWWRWTAVTDVGWALPGAVSLYWRAELNPDPVRFDAAVLGVEESYTEERFRWGVVVEFSGALRSR